MKSKTKGVTIKPQK